MHGSHCKPLWWRKILWCLGCFTGDIAGNLFKITSKSTDLLEYRSIPSGFCLVGPLLAFQRKEERPKDPFSQYKGYSGFLCSLKSTELDSNIWQKANMAAKDCEIGKVESGKVWHCRIDPQPQKEWLIPGTFIISYLLTY